ncbi:MAG: AAA family ATPase [Terracidiphilus sp.]
MLQRLILQNYKSIASASIDFAPFTFLVGRNGSGKSNIADALAFLTEAMEWPLQTVFNRRGGPLSVVHRSPHNPVKTTSGPPLEFGIGIEFTDVSGWNENFERLTVGLRYAFLISVTRFGFRVVREQCVVNSPNEKRVWFDRRDSKIRSSVEFLNGDQFPFISPDALAMPFVGTIPQLTSAINAMKSMAAYSIDPGKLREFQDPDAGKRLLSDGSNAASVLGGIKADSALFRRLFEILSTVIPDLERVRPQTIGRKQHLRFVQQWSPDERVLFDAFNMSDGTLRAFGILLALFQNERPDVLLIEEPETSLHPAATAAIVETLREESIKSQIIISTHSPEVLDLARPESDNFKVVTWSKGQTHIGDITGAAKSSLQNHLASAGELFRMLILDAPPLFEELEADKQQNLFEELDDHPANS